MSAVKAASLCVNYLRPGHYVKQCRSAHRCYKCQKSHHTLLHVDRDPTPSVPGVSLTVNASPGTTSGSILMTCRVLSRGPDGSSIESRALLDSASSVSFVSERLAQNLRLPRSRRDAKIHGVTGLAHYSHAQSFTSLVVSPLDGVMGNDDILFH